MQPKLRLPLLILAAALLALPANATASTRSESATAMGHLAITSATAKCPSGQRATGGGFTAPALAPTGASPGLLVHESRKIGQRSWRVSAQVIDLGASGQAFTVRASVYCSDAAPSTKSKSANVTSTGTTLVYGADARCGSGKAQAGGFRGPPPNAGIDSYVVEDSYRADKKTWRSRMATEGAGATLTSYVYCADEKKPAARTGSVTAADNTFHTALSAKCKQGTKPVAGGFSQPSANLASGGGFVQVNQSVKSGKRWRVTARHSGLSSTLNSIAYCA
jgi:hypothetical protein